MDERIGSLTFVPDENRLGELVFPAGEVRMLSAGLAYTTEDSEEAAAIKRAKAA